MKKLIALVIGIVFVGCSSLPPVQVTYKDNNGNVYQIATHGTNYGNGLRILEQFKRINPVDVEHVYIRSLDDPNVFIPLPK